jgi:hypothetical protein
MRAGLAILSACLLAAASAWASENGKRGTVESVTVTGERAHEAASKLVKRLATPAPVSGKISRWRDGICPVTVGLRPEAVTYINDRLRAVAADVGAPVNAKAVCTPNIEIVFTTTPQALMNTVRRERPQLLGFAQTTRQMDDLARVVRAIQAWYTTQTRDIDGDTVINMAHRKRPPQQGVPPDAIMVKTTGSRLGNGLTSDFYHVVIAADPTRLADYPIGQVADYITLLALSHVDTPDTCQALSSIVNLLVPGCASIPDGLSAADLAYLNGLYRRMKNGLNAGLQRSAITRSIEEQGQRH